MEEFIETTKKLFADGSDRENITRALNKHGYDGNTFELVDESKRNTKSTYH